MDTTEIEISIGRNLPNNVENFWLNINICKRFAMNQNFESNQTELIILCRKMAEEIDVNYPITFGYLFGSRAVGNYREQSDLDLAFMFEKQYPPHEEYLMRGDLMELCQKQFQMAVDVVSLASAPLFLQFNVIQEGITIIEKSSRNRAEFESLVRREYFDFQYYSDYYNQKMIESIKEGTYFGGTDGRS